LTGRAPGPKVFCQGEGEDRANHENAGKRKKKKKTTTTEEWSGSTVKKFCSSVDRRKLCPDKEKKWGGDPGGKEKFSSRGATKPFYGNGGGKEGEKRNLWTKKKRGRLNIEKTPI